MKGKRGKFAILFRICGLIEILMALAALSLFASFIALSAQKEMDEETLGAIALSILSLLALIILLALPLLYLGKKARQEALSYALSSPSWQQGEVYFSAKDAKLPYSKLLLPLAYANRRTLIALFSFFLAFLVLGSLPFFFGRDALVIACCYVVSFLSLILFAYFLFTQPLSYQKADIEYSFATERLLLSASSASTNSSAALLYSFPLLGVISQKRHKGFLLVSAYLPLDGGRLKRFDLLFFDKEIIEQTENWLKGGKGNEDRLV